jgi:hypothetical protein
MRFPLRFFSLLLATQLSGCIAYAPSNTNWRSTPKVVLQVCIPTSLVDKAEIAYYRPQNLGVWTANPIAKTKFRQSLFEGTYDDYLGSAFGVSVIRKNQLESSKYYIFLTHETATSDWSPWIEPDEIESSFPKEVWKFKRTKGLMAEASKDAPKIRFRRELLKDYESSKRSRERYSNIPPC